MSEAMDVDCKPLTVVVQFGPDQVTLEHDWTSYWPREDGQEWAPQPFYRAVIDEGRHRWPPFELSVHPPGGGGGLSPFTLRPRPDQQDDVSALWLAIVEPTTPEQEPSVEAYGKTLQEAVTAVYELYIAKIGKETKPVSEAIAQSQEQTTEPLKRRLCRRCGNEMMSWRSNAFDLSACRICQPDEYRRYEKIVKKWAEMERGQKEIARATVHVPTNDGKEPWVTKLDWTPDKKSAPLPLVLPVMYIDIDGTMTIKSGESFGAPRASVIAEVRNLIARGYPVYVWTGNCVEYARAFCDEHGIKPAGILPKPNVIVDDDPNLLPSSRLWRLTPDQFLLIEWPRGDA